MKNNKASENHIKKKKIPAEAGLWAALVETNQNEIFCVDGKGNSAFTSGVHQTTATSLAFNVFQESIFR